MDKFNELGKVIEAQIELVVTDGYEEIKNALKEIIEAYNRIKSS